MTQYWSIQDIARFAGTTSRTLRHYDAIGLLKPSRIGENGYRQYDQHALIRLQRILLLRNLGLGLTSIAEVLANGQQEVPALEGHLHWLRQERERLERQIASVERTIVHIQSEDNIVAESMFDGFDNSQYKDEVIEKYGQDAWNQSNNWWEGKSDEEKLAAERLATGLMTDWRDAANRGVAATSDDAQAIARRQFDWLTSIPGIPNDSPDVQLQIVVGIAEMYVADERFHESYGGEHVVTLIRDAMKEFAARR